ncbi:hypothetical protein CSV79_00345 [Sporosarcina sp. P13]|uniref:DUF2975 domain-containing protein n=1 Tax=Sporosarcina sp. P13 TaxID=2048263 RepID=UPI000C16A590|nr:DUF2975 domain-containing protein [Sporosarcina sp. P13]PIC65562.1 hypothetical protein CSV79_00345 [Sporosarcina sp. P13]
MKRKKGSTTFLKIAVILMGIPVLALCIFLVPELASEAAEHYPGADILQYPFLIGIYVTAILFFVILYQALSLLNYIDKNKAFSELSIKSLKNIKYCAVTISILYVVVIMPFIYRVAQGEDAPGLIIIGMAITLSPTVIAVFAAVLQRLLQEAIDIKSENELTV